MQEVTIWHNAKCSKSRAALALLEERNLEIKVLNYLEEKPSREDIKNILILLNIPAKNLLRSSEDLYEALSLKDINDEELLIEAMYKNPILIQRPIIIKEKKAVIARPIVNLELLLK